MSTEKKQESLEDVQIITATQGDCSQTAESLSLPPSLLDPRLVPILEDRLSEAQRCSAHSPMACIMLCGSFLEGFLIGLANKRPGDFNRSPLSPKDENGKPKLFRDWSLAQLIDVAHGLGIIRLDVKNFGQHLRNFRNYIHPYQQMKEDFRSDGYTAQMCLTAVKAVVHNTNANATPKQDGLSSDWVNHPNATHLALVNLVGSWNERKEDDKDSLARIVGIEYGEWIKVARELLHCANTPLSLKDGVWTIIYRTDLFKLLGSRILDKDVAIFESLAVSILKEPDPAFELPADERYAAGIHGKTPNCSPAIRQSAAEGLAILGNFPDCCSNCSLGRSETTAVLAVREIFEGADWRLWGSLNNLLPTLAEAAPKEFLDAVESALRTEPCPFDELFAQEGDGITGGNYMTGLLWALEGLAWEEQYLVRACSLLAELASHDPGGQWANRPGNSLTDILLPWMPHTLASTEKREVAARTIVHEWPGVGWDLLLSLLPNQRQMTSGTYKPQWRMTIPDNAEKGVTHSEYWRQVSHYAELAVNAAGQDVSRLSDLIDRFDNLTKPAFDELINALSSESVQALPEEQKQILWQRLSAFTRKHRRYADAKWSLPDELLTPIDEVSRKLAPVDPMLRYQELFSGRDFDLYEESGNWQEQRRKLDERRVSAIKEIIESQGIDGAIRFAESVASPRDAGAALAAVAAADVEKALLPGFLDSEDRKHLEIATAFVSRRYRDNGWAWCDAIDRTGWRHGQTGQFLACLPFSRDTWGRAEEWLENQQGEYWTRASAFPFETDEGLAFAIDKLLEHGRPYAAIGCLGGMLHQKLAIDSRQCVRVLLAALDSSESNHAVDSYNMVELIKHLQSDAAVSDDDLFSVEWAYLPLLDQLGGAQPAFLHKKLANDPEFFCELVQIIFPSSEDDNKPVVPSEKQKAIAVNACRLLQGWSRPPGVMDDGSLDAEHFKRWLKRVRGVCAETGHLDVALNSVGNVLIHAPADKDGLWLDTAVAEALNDRDSEGMRKGFRTALYNTRGVHAVDPSGKPEMDLAEKYRMKGEDVENAGFHRLADTLRDLSDAYIREAERVRSDFGGDKDE